MTITAVLFDFGGVILSSPFEAFEHYEERHGIPRGFIRSVNAAEHHTNAWARLERNQISLEEFAAEFEEESAALGHRISGFDVLELLAGELRPEMVEVVRRCGERFKTALLTNNVVSMGVDADVAHVVAMFDVVVESSVVGVRKPEIEFYEIACARLSIEPTEAVFLDDLGVNLKPARELGMTTIKVVDPGAAITELEDVVGFALR